MAWLLAALMRLATGSATVAMTTAAGIVAPIALHSTGVHPELLAIATGAGSLIFSHVNDGGFWLVKEYLGMSVTQTMKTWSSPWRFRLMANGSPLLAGTRRSSSGTPPR